MSTISWLFASHVEREIIEKVSGNYCFTLPEDLIQLIMTGNNGTPSKKKFDSAHGKEHMVKTLLSYNPDDIENVYSAIEVLKESCYRLYPIANDPAGNLICLSPKGIVLWDHETDSIDLIAPDIATFLSILY